MAMRAIITNLILIQAAVLTMSLAVALTALADTAEAPFTEANVTVWEFIQDLARWLDVYPREFRLSLEDDTLRLYEALPGIYVNHEVSDYLTGLAREGISTIRPGLVRQVLIDRERVFYDTNRADHYHVYDVDSGELRDVMRSEIEIASIPELPEGARIVDTNVILRVSSK